MTGHIDRETLTKYVKGDPTADRLIIATHLGECSACQDVVEELQAISLLGGTQVFDSPERRASDRERAPGRSDILAARQKLLVEAARAETFFLELMEQPIEEWPAALAAHPGERTEGLVSRVLREVDVELKRRPAQAMLLIDIAEGITTALDLPAMHLRAGDCWKQRSNALRHLGRYPESLDAADIAAVFYRLLPVGDFELGQALYGRAVTLFKMTEHKEALTVLAAATGLLRQFGDSIPFAKALMLDAAIRFEQGEIARAEKTWIEVVPMLERFDDRIELARVRANLAEYSLKNGNLENALAQARAAAAGFSQLRMEAERIRCEWTVASISLALGEHEAALDRFYRAAEAFQALGMAADAGFVKLDITEELLRREDWSEAAAVSRDLVTLFATGGVTLASVMALSYLRTAVEGERATPALVRYVREFVTADDPATAFEAPS